MGKMSVGTIFLGHNCPWGKLPGINQLWLQFSVCLFAMGATVCDTIDIVKTAMNFLPWSVSWNYFAVFLLSLVLCTSGDHVIWVIESIHLLCTTWQLHFHEILRDLNFFMVRSVGGKERKKTKKKKRKLKMFNRWLIKKKCTKLSSDLNLYLAAFETKDGTKLYDFIQF